MHPRLHPAARSPAQGGDLTGRGLPFTELLGGPRRAAAPDGHKEFLLEGSMGWNTQRSGVSLQAAYETCSPETPAPEQNALAARRRGATVRTRNPAPRRSLLPVSSVPAAAALHYPLPLLRALPKVGLSRGEVLPTEKQNAGSRPQPREASSTQSPAEHVPRETVSNTR